MSASEQIDVLYREERSRMLATLIRWARRFDDAEEVLQEAFAEAASRWNQEGVPPKPAAWVMLVAKNRLIGRRRVEKRRRELSGQLVIDQDSGDELPDDVLRLFFTCCHPVLSEEAQIALTLRTLGGLTTGEIARAFLVGEATMAQRLVRAKAKIHEAGVPYRLPENGELPERLNSVLHVVYLIFNEGYSNYRDDLAAEAIRLGRLLEAWLPGRAEVEGLLALMILHHARRAARRNSAGELVPLDEQDRTLWRELEVKEGVKWVEQALGRRVLGPYQLQAAIAAVHAEGEDWKQVALLYGELLRFDGGPVVRLNHAVAVGYAFGMGEGLRLVDSIEGLENYYPWHAARAQMMSRLGRKAEARVAFERAIRLAGNRAEREYLTRQQNRAV